ncbi:Major inner capsid protein VP3 [Folsomia candida]|uniref:Major inner capsid protein VP3 n=1 Tax=Folsomia candida TaxID=158441 RepID=A0A226DWK0_FOLCA|nr:Major inner capsid protein VP3 [Folsomia candida]
MKVKKPLILVSIFASSLLILSIPFWIFDTDNNTPIVPRCDLNSFVQSETEKSNQTGENLDYPEFLRVYGRLTKFFNKTGNHANFSNFNELIPYLVYNATFYDVMPLSAIVFYLQCINNSKEEGIFSVKMDELYPEFFPLLYNNPKLRENGTFKYYRSIAKRGDLYFLLLVVNSSVQVVFGTIIAITYLLLWERHSLHGHLQLCYVLSEAGYRTGKLIQLIFLLLLVLFGFQFCLPLISEVLDMVNLSPGRDETYVSLILNNVAICHSFFLFFVLIRHRQTKVGLKQVVVLEKGNLTKSAADFQDSPPVVSIPAPIRKHPRVNYKSGTCNICGQIFSYKGSLDLHYQKEHASMAAEPLFFTQEGQGFDNRLRLSHTILNTVRVYKLDTTNHKYTDVANVFKLIVRELEAIVQTELDQHRCVKIATEMQAHFVRPYLAADVVDFNDIERQDSDLMKHTNPDPVFKAYPHTILQSHFIPETIHSIAFKLIEGVNDFIHKGSGWVLDFISKLQFSISPFAPFRAGAYIPNNNLLKFKDKSVLLNIDNRGVDGQDDFKCFTWSCLAHEEVCGFKKKWRKHSYRHDGNVEEYKKVLQEKKINFDGIVFPMTLGQLPKFEKQNPGFAISVLGYEEEDAAKAEYDKYRDKLFSDLTNLQTKSVHRAIRNSLFPLYMSQNLAQLELKERLNKSSEPVNRT